MSEVEDYYYPNIEPIEYIDESLDKILARDDAAKHGFRRTTTFPSVTAEDIGMEVYLVGQGKFKLIAYEADEPTWKQLTSDNRNPAYTDWVIENYQPISDLLTSLSKLGDISNAIPYFSGPSNVQASPVSTRGLDLLAQSDTAAIIQNLGLGSVALLDAPLDGSYIKDGTLTINKLSSQSKQEFGFSTGDVKLSYKTSPDSGWVIANDGSIGSAASGATTRANADTEALFKLMWNIPACVVQTYTGATSSKTTASQDWLNNKRLVLPKVLGRALGIAGSGDGLSVRDLGGIVGAESITMEIENMPAHNHNLCTANFGFGQGTYVVGNIRAAANRNADFSGNMVIRPDWRNDDSLYTQGIGYSNGNGTPIDNMQPTSFLNLMIKL